MPKAGIPWTRSSSLLAERGRSAWASVPGKTTLLNILGGLDRRRVAGCFSAKLGVTRAVAFSVRARDYYGQR